MKEIPIALGRDNKQIVGILHIPENKNPSLLIMCHGWGFNKLGTWQGLFLKAAREFCKKGFSVLRFDFRGSGDSNGEFEEQTVETMLDDLDCILDNLGKDYSRIGLIGHSVGGKIAVLKAAEDKRIKCLALWSAAASHNYAFASDFVDEVRSRKRLLFVDSGLWINEKQLNSYLKNDGFKAIRKVRMPLIIVNGSEDLSVFPSHAKKLYKNANNPKKLVFIKGANHFFLDDNSKEELFKVTIEWFDKWLTTKGSK